MAGLLVVFFPFVLLGSMILMERVEDPLRTVAVEHRVEEFLDEARPDDGHLRTGRASGGAERARPAAQAGAAAAATPDPAWPARGPALTARPRADATQP